MCVILSVTQLNLTSVSYLKCSLKELKFVLLTCKDRISISKIHTLLISSGLSTHGFLNSQLIASYAKVGDIDFARKVFDELPKRGIDAWNAMIIAYSRKGHPCEAINLYKEMIFAGVKPDSSTFTAALKACTILSDLELGEQILQKARECGYENDVFVGSSSLNFYSKCGKIDSAMSVFEKMERKDVVCWTTMITGFAQSGKAREAVEMYQRMQKDGLEGDEVVMLGLIHASANIGDIKLGCSIHGYMIRKGLPMNVLVQTSLVDMYAKNGELGLASRVFRKLHCRNSVSWSALISGYAQNGLAEDALELLVEMQNAGFAPDMASLVSALLACSHVGFSKLGKSVHSYILRRSEMNQVLGTALIDMYAKCGLIACARTVYDRLILKDLICWNAIIASYGIHGLGGEALSLFCQMKDIIEPDHATFAALFSALSHSGLVDEGRYWFDAMINQYKIQPTEKHYACLVDLLARAGQVEEAKKLINSMQNEPGIAVWVALLSGCHNHKKFLIGELAARKVLELKPDSLGIYMLVSNFFAAAKKWEEVAAVRKFMRGTGMKKVPGYSLVEVNGRLHAFLMEDKSHPQHDQIAAMLQKLGQEMAAMGYSPKTESVLHNVEEDVKVAMLCSHSERLAIAYALLNTAPGARLMVTKNLRVCGDCHEATKFISIIVKREITVRDFKRFHHFKDGVCSCGDYW
nr:putative pentatricopeptide repeat-containing protein At3g25060, mitochondrial [Ipomoea batatas]GME15094.1 putative pentatricopeptide repeat-containing protein At3g25060, mitochondrial [Ipomoea batatas]